MLMHRLVVADVAYLNESRMLLCTRKPRSAIRGYSRAIFDARFSCPDQFVLHHFSLREALEREHPKGFLTEGNQGNEDFSKFGFYSETSASSPSTRS
jgi:hypothetical protein